MPVTVTAPMTDIVLAHAPAAFAVEIGNEAVILDESTQRLHLLNPMAAVVWACIDGSSTLDAICSDLADELCAPFEVVLRDTQALTQRLVGEGLIIDGSKSSFESTIDSGRESPILRGHEQCTHGDPIPDPRDATPGVLPEPANP